MIIYLDTSALIKRYCFEDGSRFLSQVLATADTRISSVLLYAEMVAGLCRKRREGMLPTDFEKQLGQFEADYSSLTVIALDNVVGSVVKVLCAKHSLRGADAVHLASALIRQSDSDSLTFVAADQLLLNAAAAEGLDIIDVSHDSSSD